MDDHYKTLGVSPRATKKDIKKAYKILVKKHHPDVSGYDSAAYFTQIIKAYEVLSDDSLRATYDAFYLSGTLSNLSIYCGTCLGTGFEKKECYLCQGIGFSMKKVEYGKTKVQSKIICTLCQGTGIIKTVCFSCT